MGVPAVAPPPPRARNLNHANHLLDRLWQEKHEAEARARQAERARAEAEAYTSLILTGLRNPHVKPQQYLSSFAASAHLASVPPEERAAGGWCRVPLPAIAERAGCSPKIASKHIEQVLVEPGLVEKELRRGLAPVRDRATGAPLRDERGEPIYREVKEVWLRERVPTHLERVRALTTVTPPSHRPQGGQRAPARPICPAHPEAATVERWTLHCTMCDRQLDQGERAYESERPDEGPGEDPNARPASPWPALDGGGDSAPAEGPSWATQVAETSEGGGSAGWP